MGQTAGSDREYVIEVFFDHAETPVWYNGALDWEDISVSAGLRAGLEEFNQHPGRILGERVAEQLAVEVGAPFVVDFRGEDGRRRKRFVSDTAGTFQPAARAFHRMWQQDRDDERFAARVRAEHPDADWYIGDPRTQELETGRDESPVTCTYDRAPLLRPAHWRDASTAAPLPGRQRRPR